MSKAFLYRVNSGKKTDLSDTTAETTDVLAGKYFYSNEGVKTEGSIPTYTGATTFTPNEYSQSILTNHKYVSQNITLDPIPSNYKDITEVDVSESDILQGKRAVNSQGVVIGGIPTYSGATTITANGELDLAGKYLDSNISINVTSGVKLGSLVDKSITSLSAAELGNISSIGAYTFFGCRYLSTLEIPQSVQEIGDSAFEGCRTLENISLPSNVSSIGFRAFRNCNASITWGTDPSITLLGEGAFNGWQGTYINIPDSVQLIEEGVFQDCRSLIRIDIDIRTDTNTLQIRDDAIENCNKLVAIVTETEDPNLFNLSEYSFPENEDLRFFVPDSFVTAYRQAWDAYDWSKGDDGQGGTISKILPLSDLENYLDSLPSEPDEEPEE